MMQLLLLLFILFPANLSAEEAKVNCQEIREVLNDGVAQGIFLERYVDAAYQRCVRYNERQSTL